MASPEFFTREGCFITEIHNHAEDPAVSVARARVERGVRTALHAVDFDERYLIETGRGLMTLGIQPPFPVGPGDAIHIPAGVAQRIENSADEDLVFLCVCTPRFRPEGYRELEPALMKPAPGRNPPLRGDPEPPVPAPLAAGGYNSRMLRRGTGVSSGIAQGSAFVLACAEQSAGPIRSIAADEVELELARFESALRRAEKELATLEQSVRDRVGPGEAEIFTAQAMVLRDPSFQQRMLAAVRDRRLNVEAALTEVIEGFTRSFDKISDPYLRERAADIRDVGRRVLSALLDRRIGPDCLEIPAGSIVVAEELLPSVTANLELGQARGLVIEHGGRFSHSSILARSMGTPAVVGIENAALVIKTGDHLIVDGVAGIVFVNPEPRVLREYDRLEGEFLALRQALGQVVDLALGDPGRDRHPAAGQRQQVRRHRGRASVQRRGHRSLPDRVRILDPQRPAHRGGTVRVPGEGGPALSPAPHQPAPAGSGRRQAAALSPPGPLAQPVARRIADPGAVQAPGDARVPAAGLLAGERRPSGGHPGAGGGRPGRDPAGPPGHGAAEGGPAPGGQALQPRGAAGGDGGGPFGGAC